MTVKKGSFLYIGLMTLILVVENLEIINRGPPDYGEYCIFIRESHHIRATK